MIRSMTMVVLCFLLTIYYCSAQSFNTPEVFSFKQEAFNAISYYTGQANISIPITQVKTAEVTVPISINYVGGAGFRPFNPYSSIGMGWRLSAGGAITRTKNGVCDETLYPNSGSNLNGFFKLSANSVSNSFVRNNVISYTGTNSKGIYFDSTTEYSPDVFSFSFLGYSGYFLMGYDGRFKIQSQDIDSVQLINNVSWPGIGNEIAFNLYATDGTVFTFGGTTGSMELSGGSGPTPWQCDAWYITQIKSPNGRTVTFNYLDNKTNFVRFNPSSGGTTVYTNSPVTLSTISFNGGTVAFTSVPNPQSIVNAPCSSLMYSSIQLKNADGTVVSTANFTTSAWISQRYYFLDAVTIDGRTYSFSYNNRSGLPSATGNYFGTDYWGFYNGQNQITAQISQSSFWDQYMNPTVAYAPRMPNLNYTQYGVLTSITYPTGGTETFNYELNTYCYTGVMRPTGPAYNYNASTINYAGGLRISSITLGNMVRKYRYVNSFDPNNPDNQSLTTPSTGILYRVPGTPYLGNDVVNTTSVDGEPAVVYSKVIEYLADKSYTEYTLRTPIDIPDHDNSTNSSYYTYSFSNTAVSGYYSPSGFVGCLGKPSSSSHERGQVSLMRIFDGSNTLKKTVSYTYNNDPNRYTQNVAAVNFINTADQKMALLGADLSFSLNTAVTTFAFIHSYEIYYFPVYLQQEVETSYEAGNTIQKTTNYQYNAQKLRSVITTTNSTGDVISTQIKYPSDINTGVYASMAAKSMLNYPIEQVQLTNSQVTGSKLKTYKSNVNGALTYYVPDKTYVLEITGPIVSPVFAYFNGTTLDSRYGTVPEISNDVYNAYGNVGQTTGKDGIVTSYLWDALGIYPMAQVKGASYSTISSQDAKVASYSSSTLFSSLKTLVPSAFISTYSYTPQVGMASATDVRGRSVYYNYDSYNRLVMVRDNEKNVIKQYCYNYQGQPEACGYFGNSLWSRTLARNNCTGCQIGTYVTYTVPANTYFATTQAAADLLAQNDMTANAQNYANANGSCAAPVLATLNGTNSITTISFAVQFYNTCTNTYYNYNLGVNTSGVTLSPQLPTGNYTVTFQPYGGPGSTSYGFYVNGYYQYATSGNLLNVAITSGSNTVRVAQY